MLGELIDTDGDWVLMIVRVVLGVVLFAHGAQKLLGWFGGPGLNATHISRSTADSGIHA